MQLRFILHTGLTGSAHAQRERAIEIGVNMLNKKNGAAKAVASAILAAMLVAATAIPALAATDVTKKFKDVKAGAWYVGNVQWAYDSGYITGYTDGSGEWGVGDPVTRAQLAAMLARHAGADTSSKKDATGIADLKKGGQWYTGAVNWAVSEGVITGYTDSKGKVTAFGPNDKLSREQAATILSRYAAKCGVDTSASLGVLNVFPDKKKIASWSDDSVAWIVSEGIMSGYSAGAQKGFFGPADNVLREQMAKMLQGTIVIIEKEGASGEGPGSGSGDEGDKSGNDEGPDEGGNGGSGDEGASGDESGSAGNSSPYNTFDLASGAHKVTWRGPAAWWSDFAGYGKITLNSFEKRKDDPLSACNFFVVDIKEDGTVTTSSMVNNFCDESVSYNPTTRRYTVTYVPEAGEKDYFNKLVYTTPAVPYVNTVCYAGVKCWGCNHAAFDAGGEKYATYLADSANSMASDYFINENSPAPELRAYLASSNNGIASGYGEYEAHLEGRHVSEVWAECASKWRESLSFFNCGNDDDIVDDYILVAPWNLAGKEFFCIDSTCPNYGKVSDVRVFPIHGRSLQIWASGE